MLRLDNSNKQQPSFWESVLPPELFQMNDTLVLKLKERKIVRGRKLRIDTMVVEADIHHPTIRDCLLTVSG